MKNKRGEQIQEGLRKNPEPHPLLCCIEKIEGQTKRVAGWKCQTCNGTTYGKKPNYCQSCGREVQCMIF